MTAEALGGGARKDGRIGFIAFICAVVGLAAILLYPNAHAVVSRDVVSDRLFELYIVKDEVDSMRTLENVGRSVIDAKGVDDDARFEAYDISKHAEQVCVEDVASYGVKSRDLSDWVLAANFLPEKFDSATCNIWGLDG